MNEELEQLKTQVAELQAFKESLLSVTTLPLEVQRAVESRLEFSELKTSSKSATSENKSVNEGGVATYSVMDKPDGFLELVIKGTLYHVPYFT